MFNSLLCSSFEIVVRNVICLEVLLPEFGITFKITFEFGTHETTHTYTALHYISSSSLITYTDLSRSTLAPGALF